ncbi:MAG: hypothetical protein AB7H66_00200 [Hyphomonadaceae bacterium]
MSDISIEFTWFEWIAIALMAGWPGLIIGGVLGVAVFWKKGRIAAGIVGSLMGCFVWFSAVLFLR